MKSDQNIKFATDRLKVGLYLIPAISIFFIVYFFMQNDPFLWFNWFYIFYSLHLLVIFVMSYNKLYKNKYGVQFDDFSIKISDGLFAFDPIEYDQVLRIKKVAPFITNYILLFSDNEKLNISEQPFLKKIKMKWNIFRFGTPFVINADALEFMPSKVANIIKKELLFHNSGMMINETDSMLVETE